MGRSGGYDTHAGEQFGWHTFDVGTQLPRGWDQEIAAIARSCKVYKELVSGHSVTSREASPDVVVPVFTVDGTVIARRLPWLAQLYHGLFRELAQRAFPAEKIMTAQGVQYGLNLNVQHRGVGMVRYECHVDSNPVQGLLYTASRLPGTGGELVVSNRGDVRGVEAIDADAARIIPVAGHLLLFDGRGHSHYVSALSGDGHGTIVAGSRTVVAMNFYTPSCPEEDRPADLSGHLFAQPGRS
jgi:hypothetical protein